MHRRSTPAAGRWPFTVRASLNLALAAALSGAWVAAHAQAAPPNQTTLRAAFESAWARQPEAQALAARRDAARAHTRAAQAWTPEPVAVAVATKTDRLNRNLGSRDNEVGIDIPLWLPGERRRSQALADAEGRAVESHSTAARLRVAASVRDAWWAWQRAQAELDSAIGQRDSVRRIAADVARRVMAGDLARSDQHQADGAVAAADAAVAQAEGALTASQQQLLALTALPAASLTGASTSAAEPEPPAEVAAAAAIANHADLQALQDRVAVAEGALALSATQSRASPALTLAANRERGSRGEAFQQTFALGLRIPFGAGPRHDARVASARADAVELQAQLALERARIAADQAAARARSDAARAQVVAADRRAQLALEARGFFDKSFRLGETDLPTRLRIEAEAADAQRQAARARIELAAAMSAWRQALGLLPP